MKKTAIAFVASAAAIFAASCQKEATPVQEDFVPMTISAVAEGLGTPVKSAIEFKYDVTWTADDKIYVTDGNGKNDTFTITSESIGKTLGKFTQDGETAFISQGSSSCDVEAYYPSSMVSGMTFNWPADQTYSPENTQTVPMYSKKTITATGEQTFSFASLGSVLQIVFNTTQAGVTLKSIEIKDGEKTMSGAFSVNDGVAEITATDNAGITLDLGEGKTLGKGANYFNIAVPAGDYQDLTLVFTATDGAKCTMTKGKVNIACNTVGRLTLTGEKFTAALPGEFSVSNDNGTTIKKVHFSLGNLVATIDATGVPTAWKFAANQYDCLGVNGANKTIGKTAGDVDLFGWSTASTTYGISTSQQYTDYSGYFVDWGKNIGDGNTWRTLTKGEWVWLLGPSSSPNPGTNCRTSSTVNGTSNARYAKATVNSKAGVILLPDAYAHPEGVSALTNINTANAAFADNTYDSANWAKIESAGAVFLPVTGFRMGSGVSAASSTGCYMSSTNAGDSSAYDLDFGNDNVNPSHSGYRHVAKSVRLVSDVESGVQ